MTETTRWVVLLRGINVGGHRKVPMSELRQMATELGYTDVSTYVNSGNLMGKKATSAAEAGAEFESALLETFGFEVDVVVRSAEQIAAIAGAEAFPVARAERPNLLHVVFSHAPATPEAVASIQGYLSDNERAERVGEEVWVDYADGSARSKVTHDVLKRALGGVATSRNFRTVRKLAGLVADSSK